MASRAWCHRFPRLLSVLFQPLKDRVLEGFDGCPQRVARNVELLGALLFASFSRLLGCHFDRCTAMCAAIKLTQSCHLGYVQVSPAICSPTIAVLNCSMLHTSSGSLTDENSLRCTSPFTCHQEGRPVKQPHLTASWPARSTNSAAHAARGLRTAYLERRRRPSWPSHAERDVKIKHRELSCCLCASSDTPAPSMVIQNTRRPLCRQCFA